MKSKHSIVLKLCALFLFVGTPLTQAADVGAEIDWVRRVGLTTPVSGVVDTVHVETGQQVKAGELLLHLAEKPFSAQVEGARAKLDKMEQLRIDAKGEEERAQELYNRTVLADLSLQRAKMKYTMADADYRVAKAALEVAEIKLYRSKLYAPYAGVIVKRAVEAGHTVIADDQPAPLLVLAETGRYLARARLDAQYLTGLETGQDLRVTVAGNDYGGSLRHIAMEPESDAAGGKTYAIEVLFETGNRMRAGQAAIVHLP